RYIFDRVVLELTDVDSLTDDPDVTVTTYRGLDSLLASASGKAFVPGGSQHVDERWGKRYIRRMKGKIVGGVLTTEPTDVTLPYGADFDVNTDQIFLAARLRLKLTPTSAEGLMGAYLPVDDYQHRMTINTSSLHQAFLQNPLASTLRAVRRLADG